MNAPVRDDDALVALAGAVADRTPVDWDGESTRTPQHAHALARLRELAALEAAMAGVRDASPEGVRFAWGPLQVMEKLGEGSFAEVYRAWDPALQREVALKLRREDLGAGALGARRWLDEARKLARVRHPHVLSVLGAAEHDGRAGLWTELLEGHTLESWIEQHGALGAREAAGIGVELAQALAAVHAAGLLHGDVGTRNVMREGRAGASDRSGRIVLMDFGSAEDARAGALAAFGTPAFMAPEVLAGEAPDARADVYSLGVVLYRLLTASWPVAPAPPAEMRARLERGERTPLRTARPDLPSALVEAVERACAPDRASRYSNAADLERALSAATATAPAAPRRASAAWALAAAVLAIVALAGVAWLRRPAPARETSVPPPTATTPAPASAPLAETAEPAAPAPALPVPPEVDASLVRVTAGAREVLRSGDLVAPGDEIALEWRARESLHVYVLSEDEAGGVFVLFPLAGRGAANPVAPGAAVRLPGREGAADLSWQVTSAGVRETFLILASREPLAPVADAAAALPQARDGADVAYRHLAPEALAKLRGVGGVVRGEALRPRKGARILSALARELENSREGRAVWMRLVVLENPGP